MQFDQAKLTAAIETARAKAGSNRALQNGITRAAEGLRGAWVVTELHDGLFITSDSGASYKANGTCSCPAFRNGQICKHRIAYRIVALYHSLEAAQPAVNRASLIADIKAAWSRRFPGESLADELMRRFRRNQLEMLSVDFLTAIRAAIA